MAHIEKIKTKKGTAYRVIWSRDGSKNRKYFKANVPYVIVRRFAESLNNVQNEFAARIFLKELMEKFANQRMLEIDTWRHSIALNHLIAFSENVHADKITAQVLHNFRDHLLNSRILEETADPQKIRRGVNHDFRHIRVVFMWAYRQEIISTRPFDRFQFFKTSKPVPDVLTAEELNRIRPCLAKEDRFILHFLRFTGLRVAEACAVKIKDIDTKAGEIKLYHTKNGTEETIMLHRCFIRIAEKTSWLAGAADDRVIKVTRWTVPRRHK